MFLVNCKCTKLPHSQSCVACNINKIALKNTHARIQSQDEWKDPWLDYFSWNVVEAWLGESDMRIFKGHNLNFSVEHMSASHMP